jgi:hypothetical protein
VPDVNVSDLVARLKLADLAERWVAAERERRMRRRERGRAFVVAKNGGCTFERDPETDAPIHSGPKELLDLVERACARYQTAAKRAGSLRGRLARLVSAKPVPAHEVEEPFAELLAEERDRAADRAEYERAQLMSWGA